MFRHARGLTVQGLDLVLTDCVSTDGTCLALGDQKSLSLMKSKDEEQPLSHLLQHNCFLRLGHPLPPRSGWEVSSDGRKPSLCCCCVFAAKPLLCDLRLLDPPPF